MAEIKKPVKIIIISVVGVIILGVAVFLIVYFATKKSKPVGNPTLYFENTLLTAGNWNVPSCWLTKVVPTALNTAWVDNNSGFCTVTPGSTCDELQLANHAKGLIMNIPADLTVNGPLTVAAYGGSASTVNITSGGSLVAKSCIYGPAGSNTTNLSGTGQIQILGPLTLSNNSTTDVIMISLSGTSMVNCGSLSMAPNTVMTFAETGQLSVSGNVQTLLSGYIKSGYLKPASGTGTLTAAFNANTNETVVML